MSKALSVFLELIGAFGAGALLWYMVSDGNMFQAEVAGGLAALLYGLVLLF